MAVTHRSGAVPASVDTAGAIAVRSVAVLLLGCWIALSAFKPFTPGGPGFGVDASWVTALGEAGDKGLRWGRDVAFTYGPASSLVTGYLDATYMTITLPLLLATCFLFAAGTVMLAAPAGPWILAVTTVATGAVAALSSGHVDSLFLTLPLLPVLLLLSRERAGAGRIAVAAATAFAVGMIGMAKTTYPLAALPLLLLGDAAAAWRRRPCPLLAACLLGFLFSDIVYGQSPADLPLFVRQQWEVVAGYSEAMAIDGSRTEVVAYPVACAALMLAVVLAERGARPGARSPVAVPLGLAWLLFVLFKAGFVRQDEHTLIAWYGLALAAVAVGAARMGAVRPRSAIAVSAGAVALAALFALSLVGPDRTMRPNLGDIARLGRLLVVDRVAEQAAGAVDLAANPAAFAAARRAEKARRIGELAASQAWPRLDGGVDVIPSRQAEVIVAGLDYRPRPSFQEYSTYTPALIAANRAFLAGPRAPEWVLFGPESGYGGLSIDHRYPNLAEGGVWLDLLRLYRPARRLGSLVALRKRAEPAPVALGDPRREEIGFDEMVAVDPVAGGAGPRAVFATVDVRLTAIGRALAFLLKPPPLTVTARFADGHEQLYQFISGIGASGFVLSPRIDNASEFEGLADGTPPSPERIVTGFGVHAPPRLRALFASRIAVELSPVTAGGPEPRRPPPSTWASLVAAEGLAPGTPRVEARVLSPIDVPVAGLSRVDLGFGLASGGDGPSGPGAVCFSVVPVDGSGRALWRTCLDRAAAGRPPRAVSLALPSGTSEVGLDVACTSGCPDGTGAYWAPPR